MKQHVVVIGMSHKTAPLDVRERFALGDEELPAVLSELRALKEVDGAFATSTCNRFEIYASTRRPEASVAAIRHWLDEHGSQRTAELSGYLYEYLDEAAVRHLFRVASSLDSMVIGEAQILGQVKSAVALAERAGSMDSFLARCFKRAVRVAKRVRTDTQIARHPVSVPQVAVDLAGKIFGELQGKSVLLVGAGKMSEVAVRILLSHGVVQTHVVNRRPERARELAARLDAVTHGFDELAELLERVDIVLSSTGSRDFVIRPPAVKEALRRRRYRPLFIMDIAVPRDVDPRVGQLSNVFLFDIDDLKKVVDANLGERRRHADDGEEIVARQTEEFFRRLEADQVTPTIVRLRSHVNAMKDEELRRALSNLGDLDPDQRERLVRSVDTLVNRLLHEPTVALKRLAQNGRSDEVIEFVEELFALRDDDRETT